MTVKICYEFRRRYMLLIEPPAEPCSGKSQADKRPSFHVRFRCNLFRVPPRRANTDTAPRRSVYQPDRTPQNTKPLSDNSEQFSVAGSDHVIHEYSSL